jgi:DNA-directed RNA polymerase sigma subunit (sigma70/sigma32)
MRRSFTETKRRSISSVSYDPELERSDHDETLREEALELYGERLRTVIEDEETGITESERYVLLRRFPDDPEERRLTLEEIGRSIHVSKERVRQIQNAALAKLREALTNDPILQD